MVIAKEPTVAEINNLIYRAEMARLQEEINRLRAELNLVRSALVACRDCGEKIRPDEPVKLGGLCEICGSEKETSHEE